MLDPRDVAAALWGEAGALAYGLFMLIQAFRTPGVAPGARGKAMGDLALGVFVGPLASTVFTSGCLFMFPRFDPRAVEMTLGVVAVPGFPAFVKFVVGLIPKPKSGDAT